MINNVHVWILLDITEKQYKAHLSNILANYHSLI